ncbi:MAG TPA: tetratricopeptide repeat protein [Brumimicrobium sp.]|nr:tetratricopeptide repeat protein [Brumimicrobium sp.]
MARKTYKLCLLMFVFQLTFMSLAQQDEALETNVPNVELNTKTLQKTLDRLNYYDSIQEKDSLRFYILEAKLLCKKINTFEKIPKDILELGAEIHFSLANNAFNEKQFKDAIIEFTNAQDLYQILNNQPKVVICISSKAVIYLSTGNKIEALKSFHRSIAIYTELNDSSGMATNYAFLARIYRQQNDLERTQESLEKALAIARKIDNNYLKSVIIDAMAGLNKEQGKLEESLVLYKEALSLTKSEGDDLGRARVLNNIGVIYLETDDYEKAKEFFDRSLEIVNENNIPQGIAFAQISLGRYYYHTNDYNKSIELLSEALKIGESVESDEIVSKSLKILLKIYEKLENWKAAYLHQNQLIELNDAVEKSTIEQIAEQETLRLKIENDILMTRKNKVEQALIFEKKHQRKNILYIVSIVVFLLLVAALLIIYFRLRASREKNKYITKQSEERKLLLQEVHHRVKNNFQIVSSMLRLQSYNFDNEELRLNFEEAVNRINAMAIVHDVIYRQEKFSDINSKTYLEKLVVSLRKTGDSRILIDVDSEEIPFKIETLINIGIALNELITNSFKHAFTPAIDQPKIQITMRTIGNKMYELYYKDNGVGISKDNYSSNFGMDLIETIIDNYEGEVKIMDDLLWNTSIRITFKEF